MNKRRNQSKAASHTLSLVAAARATAAGARGKVAGATAKVAV